MVLVKNYKTKYFNVCFRFIFAKKTNTVDIQNIELEINQQDALLLYFFSDRCAPCVSLRPKIEELVIHDFPKMKLIFIDSEKLPSIAAHFNVFSNPTIAVFFQGNESQRWSKYVSTQQIAAAIERPYKLLFED